MEPETQKGGTEAIITRRGGHVSLNRRPSSSVLIGWLWRAAAAAAAAVDVAAAAKLSWSAIFVASQEQMILETRGGQEKEFPLQQQQQAR